jgi:type III secretion protein V
LKLIGVSASPVVNPANNNECAAIDGQHEEKVKAAGLWTWDPLGYIVLVLASELRRNAGRLLDCESVEFELGQLYQAFPDLVLVTLEKLWPASLTRILRVLLNEGISIRDLRAILGRLLSYDYLVTDPSKYIVFDDRLALHERLNPAMLDDAELRAQHVRQGLKQYISHKLTRGTNTLVVYLLHPEIESRALDHLAGKRRLTSKEMEQIRRAVRSEVQPVLAGANPPSVLTFSSVRLFIRRLLEDEFPRFPVLAYEELSPDLNIQPIARISV